MICIIGTIILNKLFINFKKKGGIFIKKTITINDTILYFFIRNNPDIFGKDISTQMGMYSDEIYQEALNMYISKYRGYKSGFGDKHLGNKTYTFEI